MSRSQGSDVRQNRLVFHLAGVMVLAAGIVGGCCEAEHARWEGAPAKWNPHYLDAMELDTADSPLGLATFLSLSWRAECRAYWSLCEKVLEIPATAKHVIILEEMMTDHPNQYSFVLIAEYDDQIIAFRGPADRSFGPCETAEDRRAWAAIEGLQVLKIRAEPFRKMLAAFEKTGVYKVDSQSFPPGPHAQPSPGCAPYLVHVYRGRDGSSRQFLSEYIGWSPIAIRGEFTKDVLIDVDKMQDPMPVPSEWIVDETDPVHAEEYRRNYRQWREEFKRKLPVRTVVNGVFMLLYDAGRNKASSSGGTK